MSVREIIRIDEDLCDGCGLCVPSCAEGAIQIIDGKAKLVGENLCDGLGACLGECPQDALKIEKRDADEFDEEAVEVHLKSSGTAQPQHAPPAVPKNVCEGSKDLKSFAGCPGSAARSFHDEDADAKTDAGSANLPSKLGQWPVQLMLIPAEAPFLNGTDLLISADCVPYAYAGFHEGLLKGKSIVVGCPKLDDLELYAKKLQEMFEKNDLKSITVAAMEVPCCNGIIAATQQALEKSGKDIPLEVVIIGIRGDILERVKVAA